MAPEASGTLSREIRFSAAPATDPNTDRSNQLKCLRKEGPLPSQANGTRIRARTNRCGGARGRWRQVREPS